MRLIVMMLLRWYMMKDDLISSMSLNFKLSFFEIKYSVKYCCVLNSKLLTLLFPTINIRYESFFRTRIDSFKADINSIK